MEERPMPGTGVNGNNLLLGRGKVYFDRFEAGTTTRTGEVFLGNAPTLEITPTPEEIKKYSSATRAAPLMASDLIRLGMGIRIAADEFAKENLAMALYGDNALLTQSTAAITNEAFTNVYQGRYYKLAKRGISAVTVTGPSGTPVHVLDTDYSLDLVSGRVYIIPGGGIVDGTGDIEVDYTYATQSLAIVRGGNQTSVKGFIRYISDNARGPNFELEIWKVAVRSDGAIGFISDDYAQFSLQGEVESDEVTHPNEPFFRLIYTGV
jgi:hypothetical protein